MRNQNTDKIRKPILGAYHLSVGYTHGNTKSEVQKNLKLKMFTGELVCLLGPNGAGKSTLLRTLSGIQPSIKGDIKVAGKNLDEYTIQELAKVVSTVLTDQVSVDHMRVYDLIAMGRYPYTGYFGRLSVLDHEIIDEAIALAGIEPLKERFLDQLSDGERQKVMIARALAQETPFIILDEPMAFLDFPSKLELMQILRNLASEHNKAILMTTHDLSLSIQSADWIWLIGHDQRIRRGVPEDLVLKGDFADFFKKDDIKFDNHTGEFRIENNTGKRISVRGGGLNGSWIRKALMRKGYTITNAAKGKEKIYVANKPELEVTVKLKDQKVTVNSVKDLLLMLEKEQ
jgi:iron complex transport system ATP-binding protein